MEFEIYHHTCIWKAFQIRPCGETVDKFATNDKYCVYDEPHGDYLYTIAWVDFISKLFKEYDFSLDNVKITYEKLLKNKTELVEKNMEAYLLGYNYIQKERL